MISSRKNSRWSRRRNRRGPAASRGQRRTVAPAGPKAVTRISKHGGRPGGGTSRPGTSFGIESTSLRLQKFLSRAGVASRRAAEAMILSGRVKVNGRVVKEMGVIVNPSRDAIKIDGRLVCIPDRHRYFILNKPRRVVSTLADPQGRVTVRDFLPPRAGRVYPVGRLDWDAEGVLLFTDDGDLAHRLSHPRYGVERTYLVKVKGDMGEKALLCLRAGVHLEDGLARAEKVRLLRTTGANSWFSLTLREGRHREVKRLCLAVGHPVQKLRRVSYGGLELGHLRPGECRPLTPAEVARLRSTAKT